MILQKTVRGGGPIALSENEALSGGHVTALFKPWNLMRRCSKPWNLMFKLEEKHVTFKGWLVDSTQVIPIKPPKTLGSWLLKQLRAVVIKNNNKHKVLFNLWENLQSFSPSLLLALSVGVTLLLSFPVLNSVKFYAIYANMKDYLSRRHKHWGGCCFVAWNWGLSCSSGEGMNHFRWSMVVPSYGDDWSFGQSY